MKIPNRIYEGPSVPLSQEIDEMKYRQSDETFDDKAKRLASSMSDDEDHKLDLEDIFGNLRFLPAGRVQNAMGSRRITTAFNCFVSGKIEDSMDSIMDMASEAAETMRRGGGIGYDFSKIRPRGDVIKSLDSNASGPISFMAIFDAVCQTIASSGHRRGAQMGVLRVDHPDIYEFIRAKRNSDKLTGFNVSVGITDKFMDCVINKKPFKLMFDGKEYDEIDANDLWDEIMRSTWDWAEPGVLYIDRINEMNNLHYCEEISATNPCGEQPLPYYGACLLGSFNLTKYVVDGEKKYEFDWDQFKEDIPHVVRGMDNVIDRTIYPLDAQANEARDKRRMGLGVTGLANAGELLGFPYASSKFMTWAERVFRTLRNETYSASADIARQKGPFPAYRSEYNKSNFIRTLPYHLKNKIKKFGIRNSHLTSIAPTGTISLVADNVSGGIEPVFSHYYDRTIKVVDKAGKFVERTERVSDYAYERGVKGVTAGEVSIDQHVEILALASEYVDSAVSKTCNVGDKITFEEFKNVYIDAFNKGCKGITTFRAAGKRYGILNEVQETEETEAEQAEACFIDPQTGQKECS